MIDQLSQRIIRSPWSLLGAALLALVLLQMPTAAQAELYLHDDGVIGGSFSQENASYANRFVLSASGNQVLRSVLVKKPEEDYVTGSADVYLWDGDGANGMPGTVLASAMSVNIPLGTDWVEVDFSSLNLTLQPSSTVYAGFVCHGNKALYDADGGASSFSLVIPGTWQQHGFGDLMVRLKTDALAPTMPTKLRVLPVNPTLGDTLKAVASGSALPEDAPDGSNLSYSYEWRTRANALATWGDWTHKQRTVLPELLKLNAQWQVRARSKIPGYYSAWKVAEPVTILHLFNGTNPVANATEVNRTAPIVIYFRWPMIESTVNDTFVVKGPDGKVVAGTKTWTSPRRVLFFQPSAPMKPLSSYLCTLRAGAARATGGPTAKNFAWRFTTKEQMVIVGVRPTGLDVLQNAQLHVVFDRPIRPGSVTENSFKITPAIAGTRTVEGERIRFIPSPRWQASTEYTVTVGAGVTGTDGNKLGKAYVWSFRTVTAPAVAALSVSAVASAASGPTTPITINLSSAAEVGVEITNISGRLVATLPARSLPSGVSTLLWNGKSNLGTAVPAGDYLLRVQARTEDGASGHALARCSR